MNVWLDAWIWEHKPVGGVARYWEGIVGALRDCLAPDDIIISSTRLHNPGVYLPTYYGEPPDGVPMVVVVYDLIQRRFPAQFGHAPVDMVWLERDVWAADGLVAISNTTADDMSALLGVDRERITVVYPGVPDLLAHGDAPEVDIGDYFLVMHGRFGYKNIASFYRAWEDWDYDRKPQIVTVGGEPPMGFEIVFDARHPNTLTHLSGLSDAEIAALYQNARALVYPSLWEGFGFPLVEAMSLGCPVIAADTPPAREVCGEGALYAPSRGALSWCLGEVLRPATREALIEAGREQVKRYDWSKSAEALARVIRETVERFYP